MSDKGLITRKIGVTSGIDDNGHVSAITLLFVNENVVSQVKTENTDGYNAIQLTSDDKANNVPKPQKIHLKKHKVMSNTAKELKIAKDSEYKIGDKLSADLFNEGDKVSVTGVSKGKGWAGVIKRHNFTRQRKSHGAKGATRRAGSIGSMFPQKVFKGKKMAGRMGAKQVTTKNLKIALVDKQNSIIGVYGSVPGPKRAVVFIKGAK